MSGRLLVIGNHNYSSWSLRAWLALRHCALDFDVHRIALDTAQFAEEIGRYSRAARVPVLIDEDTVIWDSLAIAEYGADRTGRGWPADPAARAVARSASAEMHSGFAALRRAWPMNIRARDRRVRPDAAVLADLRRIDELWTECRRRYGANGPWLFGEYSIADSYYAPIACRLKTYGMDGMGEMSRAYLDVALAEPLLAEWTALALAETEILAGEEVGITDR
jgi:glutathione S-transferase